jgi:hypothetical protein
VVITPDFQSGNLGSNPGGTYFFLEKQATGNMILTKVEQCNLLEKRQILSLSDHKHQMVPWYSGYQSYCNLLEKRQILSLSDHKHQMVPWYSGYQSYHSATWVQIPVGSTFFEKTDKSQI